MIQIRARWPQARIVLRADSGFAREALMVWCEAHGVDYVLGLARNPRLVREMVVCGAFCKSLRWQAIMACW